MKNTSAPTTTIIVEVDRRTERYTRLEEAVPFLKELAGPVSVSRKEFNKARRMLGAALLQLRKQTEHGGWGAFRADLAARLDLNEHTLRNCIKVAEKLLTKRGNISPAKVRAAANIHTCVDLNRGELSMGKLEILAGARTPPRRSVEEIHAEMEAELEGSRGGTGAQGQSGKGGGAMDKFGSIVSGTNGRMNVERAFPPVTLLRQERARVDARHEQLMLDGVYAEARTLIENVSAMKLGVEKRSKVDELTRDYMAAVRKLVAIDVVA